MNRLGKFDGKIHLDFWHVNYCDQENLTGTKMAFIRKPVKIHILKCCVLNSKNKKFNVLRKELSRQPSIKSLFTIQGSLH